MLLSCQWRKNVWLVNNFGKTNIKIVPRPEKSNRVRCATECDLETSRMRRPWPALGCCVRKKRKVNIHVYINASVYMIPGRFFSAGAKAYRRWVHKGVMRNSTAENNVGKILVIVLFLVRKLDLIAGLRMGQYLSCTNLCLSFKKWNRWLVNQTTEKMDRGYWRRYTDNGNKGWRKLCKEREEWKRITEKAKTHSGL